MVSRHKNWYKSFRFSKANTYGHNCEAYASHISRKLNMKIVSRKLVFQWLKNEIQIIFLLLSKSNDNSKENKSKKKKIGTPSKPVKSAKYISSMFSVKQLFNK